MKKVLITSAAIVLLLLIFVYGYLQFREFKSYQNRIHQEAALVFKVNLDGIFKTMSVDFISNPAYYLSEETKNKRKQKPERGISLPANVFVYNLNSRSAQTYFCSLPVTDTALLKPYLKKVFKIRTFSAQAQGRVSGVSTDQRATILYDGENLAIAYSLKKEKVTDILNDILSGKNLLHEDAPLIALLKTQKGHISWSFNSFSGALNFKDGAAIASGTFPVGQFQLPDEVESRADFSKNAALKLWLQLGFQGHSARQLIQVKDFSVATDSLLKYYGGYLDLELGSPLVQKDTVVSYEYNDDFEKVEKISLKEVKVPHLKTTFRANTQPLFRYLKNQKIMTETAQLNKQLFPLYQVFIKSNAEAGQLSTMEQEGLQPVWTKSPYFFFATLNFDQLRKEQQFPLLNEYLNDYTAQLTTFKVTALKKDEKTALLEMNLDFKRKDINAFTQLIDQ